MDFQRAPSVLGGLHARNYTEITVKQCIVESRLITSKYFGFINKIPFLRFSKSPTESLEFWFSGIHSTSIDFRGKYVSVPVLEER